MATEKLELLRGTLDLMILRTLSLESQHGYGIQHRLEETTGGVFDVHAGSLFPALYRLAADGWIRGEWGVSENNRKAKYYRLTPKGRRRLEVDAKNWRRVSLAINRLLES